MMMNRLMCVALAIVGASLGHSSAFAATTMYVSSSGKDAGDCSSASPCKTLAYATARTRPGDTVIVEAGTYPQQIIQSVLGKSNAPITVKTQGAVTLTRPAPANGTSQVTPLLQVINSSYVMISGLTIIGMKGRSDWNPTVQPNWGEVAMQDHKIGKDGKPTTGMGVIFDHLLIEHANNTCVKMEDGEQEVTVQYSTISDCGQPNNTLDHSIYLTGPQNTITGNTISGSPGYGICAYGQYLYGESITNNDVSGAFYGGILDDGNAAKIDGNYLHGNTTGIYAATNATITRNILQNQQYGILFGINTMGGVTIDNNTFYQEPGGLDILNGWQPAGGTFTARNNIFDGTAIAFQQTVLAPGDVIDHNNYYHSSKPSNDGGHAVMSNPQFVNPGKDFHLQSTSPDINAGTNVGLPYCGNAPDIGALEHC